MFRLTTLIAALSLSAAAESPAAQQAELRPEAGVSLDVPYVSQSADLCGGAAVAMVYRYWGDAHAAAEQFAPLVDRRAGGIAEDVLVEAIQRQGWRAARMSGSLEALRHQVSQGRPVIILLEDGPARYHYVVVTGADDAAVTIHDPSWGPSRRIATPDFIRVWRPTKFWALVVQPAEGVVVGAEQARPTQVDLPRSQCDSWLDEAIVRVKANGLDEADEAFGAVDARCPGAAGPLRELAGARFAQRRWEEAETLAKRATERDPHDGYAWEVLASSRFVQNDLDGALRAWNQIGKPRVDVVDIAGLTHARYELVAQTLGLIPNTLLTADAFARAARRLSELPDRASSRIGFRPAEDGFAVVDAAIVERATRPRGVFQWGALAAKSAVNRELDVRVPGFTGQGELWSGSWRWWSRRPRVEIAFATPRIGTMPGVWRVAGSWESQDYAGRDGVLITETRLHGGLAIADWLTGNVRYGIGAAMDEWNGERRTASVAGSLERRFKDDRLTLSGDAALFMPIGTGETFRSASVRGHATTSTSPERWVVTGTAGATAVSSPAPLALWPGAGGGHARSALLRAHPLLDDGVIAGPGFGRTLLNAGGEVQRWFDRPSPIRMGIASFADAARATHAPTAAATPWQIDLGVGLRVKAPGTGGVLRVDVARGLRDGATALTVGWSR